MEHRWGRRIVVDIPVYVTAADRSRTMSAQLANLSITGALIRADFRPRVLSHVQIVFASPQGREEDLLSISAYVVHNYRHGIGVEWFAPASPAVSNLVTTGCAQFLPVRQNVSGIQQ
jgi:hypothetical protein